MIDKMVPISTVVWFQEGPGVRNTQYTNEGVKLLNVANLVDGEVDLSNTSRYVSEEEAYGKYKHFLVDKGDLIIASSGIKVDYFDKKMGFAKEEHLPLCMNTSTIRFKTLDTDVLDIRYFMYFLKSESFKQQLSIQITGSAQLNFGPSHLKKMNVKLVPIAQQRDIVYRLSRIDHLISLRKQQLLKLDELIESRFIELFGDINTNNKNWDIEPLGNLCDISRGGSPRPIEQFLGGTIPWIKIGDATDGDNIYLNSTKEHILESGVKKSRLVKSGSLIFANCGVSLGFARIITFDGCIHDGWLAFENIDSRLNKVFLLKSLNQMTEHFRAIAPAGTQPNLNTAIMKAYMQIIPPIELQNDFIAFVEQTDKLKLEVKKSLEKLEILKKSLMQQYFG